MTQQKTDVTDEVPHNRYTKTNKTVYGSQHDVAKAWSDGKYPSDDGGTAVVRNSSDNFRGVQRPDGSGVLRHYRTIEAIRTVDGTVISNKQCWARGFAHCTTPPGVDHYLPLTTINNEMDRDHRLRDISDVIESDDGKEYVVHVDGMDGAFYVGRDNSIIDGSRTMVIRLNSDQTHFMPSQVTDELLTPAPVRESDLDVVDSKEYTKTRFKDPSDEVKELEGLTKKSRRYGSDYFMNYKQYRDQFQGSRIVRQGEYFFIPAPDFKPGHESSPSELLSGYDANKVLGNHQVKRDEVWRVDGTLYVRGAIGHKHKDHNQINLGDVWHRVATHDVDVTMAPRDARTRGRVD